MFVVDGEFHDLGLYRPLANDVGGAQIPELNRDVRIGGCIQFVWRAFLPFCLLVAGDHEVIFWRQAEQRLFYFRGVDQREAGEKLPRT